MLISPLPGDPSPRSGASVGLAAVQTLGDGAPQRPVLPSAHSWVAGGGRVHV